MNKKIVVYMCRNCHHLNEGSTIGHCRYCYYKDVFDVSEKDELQIKEELKKTTKKVTIEHCFYPWADVEDTRVNLKLQSLKSIKEAKQKYIKEAKNCPTCFKNPSELNWFCFSSPDWTWQQRCGSAGWIVVCDDCKVQVSFFLEIMN